VNAKRREKIFTFVMTQGLINGPFKNRKDYETTDDLAHGGSGAAHDGNGTGRDGRL